MKNLRERARERKDLKPCYLIMCADKSEIRVSLVYTDSATNIFKTALHTYQSKHTLPPPLTIRHTPDSRLVEELM